MISPLLSSLCSDGQSHSLERTDYVGFIILKKSLLFCTKANIIERVKERLVDFSLLPCTLALIPKFLGTQWLGLSY